MKRGRRAGGLALLLLLVSGCAARQAYRSGQAEARKGNWDMAVARFTKALQKDSESIDFKIALENAKVQASRQHVENADKHLSAEELEKAVEDLEIATRYDPTNKAAAEELAVVKARIEAHEEEKRRLRDYDRMKERANIRVPAPVLSPRNPIPVTMHFADQSLDKIFEILSKLAAVNILLDPQLQTAEATKRYTLNLANVSFEQAMDEVAFLAHVFYKVLDSNTIIVARDDLQSRKHYEDNVVRTFYLQSADAKDMEALVQKLVQGSQTLKVASNPNLGSLTVRGTADEVALVYRIVEANDKSKGEVVVEVQILEVNTTKLKEYGISLSQYEIHASFNPTGGTLDSSGFTSVQAQVLSSLNLSDFVVSVPSTLFARFLQNDSNVRILASPRLRAAAGDKTGLKVVTQIPIPTTTFQSTNTGGATFSPITQTVYRDVGVNMEITPTVNPNGDIVLKMTAEFSEVGDNVTVQNTTFPSFLSRNVNGVLRVHDGETSLIGGLVQGREATTMAGILGLQDIPILNKIFGSNQKTREDLEIIISLTPHLVRGPKLTESDLRPLLIGTGDTIRVPGARPPLFGPSEEPAPSPSPAVGAVRPTPPPPAPSPGAPPLSPPSSAEAPRGETVPSATLVWSPPVSTGKAGEVQSLSLVLMGVRGATSLDASLSFDPSALEAVDVGAGPLLSLDGASLGIERSLEPGHVHVRISRATGVSGSGAVLILRVKGSRPGTAGVAVDSLTLGRGSESERPPLPPASRVEVLP